MSQNDPKWVPPVVDEGNQTRVRAGVTGQGVRAVLFTSLGIVIVAFAILYAWHA